MIKFEKKDELVPYVLRVRKEDREKLDEEASALKERLNKIRPDGTKMVTKGDVVTEALKLGLAALRKQYSSR